MKLLGRLILLPIKLLLAAVETAFQVGRMVGGVPMNATRRITRLLGFRGTIGLVVGLALGLLFAPGPGRELRARITKLLARRSAASDADLAERVAFELEHAPRTWHLPQPAVTVDQGRVVLAGTATEATARDELARVAGAVPGVTAVENLVVVDADSDAPGGASDAPGGAAEAGPK